MNTNYRLLLEKFISYFVKGVSVAEIPGQIVILGNFYKNCTLNGSAGFKHDRFTFDIEKSANETCREVLQNILDDSFSDGFQYYPEGDEYGCCCKHIGLESIEDIEDVNVRNSLLRSDIDTSSPSVELIVP